MSQIIITSNEGVRLQLGTRRDNRKDVITPTEVFVRKIAEYYSPPQDFFPTHKNVRMFKFVGKNGVCVLEFEPAMHTFRWITDKRNPRDSAPDIGKDVQYQERILGMPYLVLVLPFASGMLQTGACQAFYRTKPLASWRDELYMTNILNIARGYGFTSWVCMIGYHQVQGISWQDAIEDAVRYFFWSAFNRSSEVNELNSHYGTVRGMNLHQGLESVDAWELATREDPLFMTKVPWPETGHTVESAIAVAFSKMSLAGRTINLENVIQSSQESAC
jgi:hypothetical protein